MPLDTTPVAETDTFTSDICPPLQGTANDAADVAAGLRGLANRTKNLKAHKWSLEPGSYATGEMWHIDTGTAVASPANGTVKAGKVAAQMIQLPHGAVFSSFTVRIAPGAHGASYPPASFPTLGLYVVNVVNGVGFASPTDTVTDAPASQGAYQTAHDLELTLSGPMTIDRAGSMGRTPSMAPSWAAGCSSSRPRGRRRSARCAPRTWSPAHSRPTRWPLPYTHPQPR